MSVSLLPFDPRQAVFLQFNLEGYRLLSPAQKKRAEALIEGETLQVRSEKTRSGAHTVALLTLEGVKIGTMPRMYAVQLYGFDAHLSHGKVVHFGLSKSGVPRVEASVFYNAATPLALTCLSLYPGIDRLYFKLMPAYARVLQGLRQSPYESLARMRNLVAQNPGELYLALRLTQMSAKLASLAEHRAQLLALRSEFGLQNDALLRGWLRETDRQIEQQRTQQEKARHDSLLSHASNCFDSGLYAYALQGYLLALQEGSADASLMMRIGEIYDLYNCHSIN